MAEGGQGATFGASYTVGSPRAQRAARQPRVSNPARSRIVVDDSEGVEDENYLRGVQVADADGTVTFTSIFPACHTGRWPHIHFEVCPDVASITDNDDRYSSSIQTFANVSIETDGIFDPGTIDQQMITLTGDRTSGFSGWLVVPVDTTTTQTASMGGGSGGTRGPGSGMGGAPDDTPPG